MDWYNRSVRTDSGSQLAYQYDHLSNLVVFDNAPKLENYYLIVAMRETEDGEVKTMEPIQLGGSFWLIPNLYTQIPQTISFQVCCKTESGDFENHSAQFSGVILPSKNHDGEALDVDPTPMFDAYKAWVNEQAMAAGAIIIDKTLSVEGAAADAKAVGDYHMTDEEAASLLLGVVDPEDLDVIGDAVKSWLDDNPEFVSDELLDEVSELNGRVDQQDDSIAELNGRLDQQADAFDAVISGYPDEAYGTRSVHYVVEWFQGGMNPDGTTNTSASRIRSDYIPVGNGISGTNISATPETSYWVRVFDENMTILGNGWTDTDGTFRTGPNAHSNPINVDSVSDVYADAKYIVISMSKLVTSESITPAQNGMEFTCDERVFVGLAKEDYTSDEITFMYPIGNGYKTRGYLKLPPNYSKGGASVPLIVFIHGSGDVGRITTTTMTSTYQSLYNYLRDSGYAVFDCYAYSDKFPASSSKFFANTWGLPINDRCYLSGIKYVCRKWNIDINNVFVACKSLGGLEAMSALFKPEFKVVAVGMLSPELNWLGMKFGYSSTQRMFAASELNFSEDTNGVLNFEESDPVPSGFYDYVTENMDKWVGVFTNFTGLPITDAQKPNYYNSLDGTKTLCRNGANKPVKIWIAEDDRNVNPANAKALIQSLRNGGNKAELRLMPSGTGGHHAVDTDTNALKTENVTTKLGIHYESVPTAYYELVEFFDQFVSV